MAIEVIVQRFVSDEDTTLSSVSLRNSDLSGEDLYYAIRDRSIVRGGMHPVRFFCWGLEDEYRREKVVAETRIPAGSYRLGLKLTGGFHTRYERKFQFHRGMIEVCGVRDFTDILIHVGNTDDDTAGCLLVGMGARAVKGDMSIQNSVLAYKALYQEIIQHVIDGNAVITYLDEDR